MVILRRNRSENLLEMVEGEGLLAGFQDIPEVFHAHDFENEKDGIFKRKITFFFKLMSEGGI